MTRLSPSKRVRTTLVAASVATVLMSQLAASPLEPASLSSPDSTRSTAKQGFVSNHVVVISIDGLRPDAIDKFAAKNLQRLMREGSFTLAAKTITPSKTLPSHTSMLTGVDADQHGITWNSDKTADHGHVDVPTVFGLAKDAGFQTAAFFSKPKFHHLEAPNTLHYVRSPKGGMLDSKWAAKHTVSLIDRYLKTTPETPNLLFVHIGEPDFAGHLFGWMSYVYGKAVNEADRAVGNILTMADERFGAGNYTVIITADHGGHGRNHGSSDERDTTIPWLAWGKGVQAGVELPADIRTMDTAATAMWMLGVSVPEKWVGKAIVSAFSEARIAQH